MTPPSSAPTLAHRQPVAGFRQGRQQRSAREPGTVQRCFIPEEGSTSQSDSIVRRVLGRNHECLNAPAVPRRYPAPDGAGSRPALALVRPSFLLRSSATAEDGSAKEGGNHVAIKQLVEDFARYLYLPRIKDPAVLVEVIRDGMGLLTWSQDSFAYADSFDETAGRYRGLRCGQQVAIAETDAGLLERPEIGRQQQQAETQQTKTGTVAAGGGAGTTATQGSSGEGASGETGTGAGSAQSAAPKRFHGTVSLDPTRVGRDASRIADEVVAHLAGLVGSTVKVTLEVEAEIPSGTPENVVRTVTENSRTLKFASHGFEKE